MNPSKPGSKVQNDFKEIATENTNLKKHNSNLQEQVSKYAMLLTEEKNEKKDLMGKYDVLQEKYHQQGEQFSVERVKLSRNFYLVLGACAILVCAVAALLYFLFQT